MKNQYLNKNQNKEQSPLCACGCGKEVTWNVRTNKYWNIYIKGHHRKNIIASKETKEKLRKSHIGQTAWNKGLTKETDKRVMKYTLLKVGKKRPDMAGENNYFYDKHYVGELNSSWNGGISCNPYCDVWRDKEYKQSIKDRDNNECQNPDCWGKCNHLSLHVHHIDYNKKNCAPQNLLTLCNSCNVRANNNRKEWQQLYEEIIKNKYILLKEDK